MTALHNYGKIALPSILTLLIFIVGSCSPMEMKKVVAQRADQYKFGSQQYGLSISVDPYIETGRLQDTFGCDLLLRGILAVLVVVENLSSEDGYIIVSDKARLVTKDEIKSGQKTDDVYQAGKVLQMSNTALAASPLFGVFGLAVLPFSAAAERSFHNELAIRRNLEQKWMVSKTIYQGSSHSGFLYFNLGKAEDLGKVQGISLAIRNIRTNEVLPFTINTGKF